MSTPATGTGGTASASLHPPAAGGGGGGPHTSSNTLAAPSNAAFVDKIDPYKKGSLKRKQKKSQGSSRYRLTSDVELQQLPLLKGTCSYILFRSISSTCSYEIRCCTFAYLDLSCARPQTAHQYSRDIKMYLINNPTILFFVLLMSNINFIAF